MSVSEPSTGQVAGAGAAGVAAGTAAAGGVLAGAGAVAAAGALVGPAAVVAALVSFLALLRAANQRWLVVNLGRYSRVPADIARVVADEMRREDQFAQASADRLAAGLPEAMAIADPSERLSRVQALLDAEKRYAQQRQEAMFARAIAAVTRAQLRRDSPLGAAWRLGRARDHTPGCIVMAGGNYAGATRFWPWAVLDRVHPPRHYGCTSSLHGFGEAVANGWIRPGEIQGVRDAIRAAAGVVMEQEEADGLLRELEVREALEERGIDTSLIPWLGEAFDSVEHPRGWHGRFIDLSMPHVIVPLDDLTPTKVEEEPAIANAWERMQAAARGERPKRAPVSARREADGSLSLIDGHATVAALRRHGFSDVPVRVTSDRRGAPRPLGWVDPPAPSGKAGERKGGGLTAVGVTNTKLGDEVERAMQALGFEDAHPGRRQGPFDLRFGNNVYEVKAVSSSATEYKAKPKKAEVDGKLAHAREHGLTPHVMIVVYDPKAKAINAYVKPGVGAYRLTSPDQGWSFIGKVPLDLGSSSDPVGRSAAEIAADALKRGEQATIKPADAPALIDKLNDGQASSLHQLQIEGHPNLFSAHARELSRAEMPQISKANLPGFMDYLRQQGVGAVVEKHRPSELRATQNQINGAAVAAMARGWDPARGGMIMVSQDGDVLDGHHRWAAAALHEMSHPENRMSTLRFSAGTDRILALMRAYNELVGVTPRAFGTGSQEIPAAGAGS